jgi:hypothetical protein
MRLLLPALLLVLPALAFAQGALTPSGTPAPTMKSLDQLEPRIPIGQVGGSISNLTISQPGSYVLLGNLTVASGAAIAITTDNVTLDLGGFTLASTDSAAASDAINLADNLQSVAIRNGHIRSGSRVDTIGATPGPGFAGGIHLLRSNSQCTNIQVEDLSIVGVRTTAIGQVFLARNCQVDFCIGTGIQAEQVYDSRATHCGNTAILAVTAVNSFGECLKNGNGIEATTATGCYGVSVSGNGLAAENATNCKGISISGAANTSGLAAQTATGCTGQCMTGPGLGLSATTALNCVGHGYTGIGLQATTASNCQGASDGGSGLKATKNATGCTGSSEGAGTGLETHVAEHCTGNSLSGTGLRAATATGCTGDSYSGTGLFADNAANCRGTSNTGTGLDTNSEANGYTGTATDCTGISNTGHGLIASVATDCTGRTTDKGKIAVWVSGTATGCRATNAGATGTGAQSALTSTIAVACTATTGTINAGSKQLGTP